MSVCACACVLCVCAVCMCAVCVHVCYVCAVCMCAVCVCIFMCSRHPEVLQSGEERV